MLLQKLFRKKIKDAEDMEENKIFEINALLKKGLSLTDMEKQKLLGYTLKTFRLKAKDIGYKYSSTENQYLKIQDVLPSVTEVIHRESKEITVKENALTLEDLNLRLESLELQFKELILEKEKETHVSDFKANFAPVKEDIVLKSIKVSAEVYKEFNKLLDTKFKANKKQDIISQALQEFIDKYK